MANIKDRRLEDKYRPTNWDGYVGNSEIVEKLKNIERKGFYKMPCILLAGPPGCGKSLACDILIRNLKKTTKNLVSYKLNASDKRKLDDIRELKSVAEKRNPTIIFMDEFDSVTDKAQDALRVMMEDPQYNNTRWFISCNNPNEIIPAIQSRCAVFRFNNHSINDIAGFIVNILDQEGIEYNIDDPSFQRAIFTLIEARNRDLRGCINQLSTIITEEGTLTLSGVIKSLPVQETNEIIVQAYSGDYKNASLLLDELLVQQSHNWQGIVKQWFKAVQQIETPDHAKRALISLSEYAHRCKVGGNPRIHLHAFLAFLSILKYLEGKE